MLTRLAVKAGRRPAVKLTGAARHDHPPSHTAALWIDENERIDELFQ